MKVVVAGGRKFSNYRLLNETLNNLQQELSGEIEVVCGMATGADSLGFAWAKKNNKTIHEMPANWDKYGKSAGYIRNTEMADFSDIVILFWDRKSKGTKHMRDIALEKGLSIKIVYY